MKFQKEWDGRAVPFFLFRKESFPHECFAQNPVRLSAALSPAGSVVWSGHCRRLHPHLHGLRPDRRPAGGLRPVRIGAARPFFRPFFHFPSVYLRRGRRSGGHGGQYGGWSWHPLRLRGRHCYGAAAGLLYGGVAAAVCPAKSGKSAQFHLGTRYGRFYQRHLLHHHPHAGAQAHGARRRYGRTAGAVGAYPHRKPVHPLAVPGAGGGCPDHSAAVQAISAQVPHGHPHHGSWRRRFRPI